MKLLRLKITDPKGFRSLQKGFELDFRTQWDLEDELHADEEFAPFVCAGPNGSGKSNLLEVLAAIFFQLEVRHVRRSFLPDSFLYDEESNPDGFREGDGVPSGFELEYLIRPRNEFHVSGAPLFAQVKIIKKPDDPLEFLWLNWDKFEPENSGEISERERGFLLPQYVLGYSSGENEILSLPFFKMRFVQFDEYWHLLMKQIRYSDRPVSRLAYLDNEFSQAILYCNLLCQDEDALAPFREHVGVDDLKAFRIIIRRSIEISDERAEGFGSNSPALSSDSETGVHTVNLMKLLEAGEDSREKYVPIVDRLKRCATCSYVDEATDTLYLDYCVDEETKKAFRENFDFEINKSPIALFQAFQILLTLNLYSVSDTLKSDLYKSDSLYVTETIPTLASDERIVRFKFVELSKTDIDQPVLLKSLSDGEHQLLHSLGLCLLFKNTNSLFLMDEPETHFNPDWRSSFVTRLRQCFSGSDSDHEMLITTHAPFLISDSKREKVLEFEKEGGAVTVEKPKYKTFGASINKITMNTFNKRETIGGRAQEILEDFRKDFKKGADKDQLIKEINLRLGESVEKMLLIKTILDSMENQN